jgi:hypothetical protein
MRQYPGVRTNAEGRGVTEPREVRVRSYSILSLTSRRSEPHPPHFLLRSKVAPAGGSGKLRRQAPPFLRLEQCLGDSQYSGFTRTIPVAPDRLRVRRRRGDRRRGPSRRTGSVGACADLRWHRGRRRLRPGLAPRSVVAGSRLMPPPNLALPRTRPTAALCATIVHHSRRAGPLSFVVRRPMLVKTRYPRSHR